MGGWSESDPLLPAAIRSQSEDQAGEKPIVDILRVFPPGFLAVCLLLSLPAMVKCLDVGFDRDYTFWHGHAAGVFAFLPLPLIALGHALHLSRRSPSRLGVFLGLGAPATVVLVLGMALMERGIETGAKFAASDCWADSGKSALDESWQRARDFYAECLRLQPSTEYGPLIEDCPGYADHEEPGWRYLAGTERRLLCGGWCARSPQLWGLGGSPGTHCSKAVAEVMFSKVKPVGRQLLVYGAVVLVLVFEGFVLLGPRLHALDIDW
mmetsp:Transcript_3792/g.11113  ORF Transcript_3792/g.11113 Transcript_3792/m.11113 type:complete len:266 (+) Transcript_3792:74-871(+)